MSCYFLAQIEIHDPHEYQLYLDGYDQVFEHYQGEVLAVDDAAEHLEGSWPSGRTVIIRFPSPRELHRWYDSPEYQGLARHRKNASKANIVAVRGRD